MAATIQHIELPKKPRAKDTSSSKQVVSQNLLADSGFTGITQAESTSGTPWTTGVGWTIGSGVASCDGSQSGVSYLYNHDTDLTDPENKFWEITYSITARSAGTVRAMVGGYGPETAAQSVVDTYTEIVGPIHPGSVPRFYIKASADFVGSVDNVSVKSVESFSNNNHGEIYSGRALEFDGVTDYFQSNGGTDLAGVNYFADGVPWTFACWIYFDSSSTGTHHYFIGNDFTTHPMLIFQNQNNINKLIFRAEDAGKDYYLFPYGHGPSLNRMDQDAWHRLVVTTDGVSLTAYVNGVHGGDITDGQDDTNSDVTFSNTGMDFSGWGTPYQNGGVRQYGLKGMMSDGQVWDATWSADDAAYDYANPESLALNASGSALTEGNLKLWYPMQDGHRGQQSYILDGANTGLGDDIAVNGAFDSDLSGWSGVEGRGTYTWDNGRAKITNNEASSYPNLAQTISTVAGQTYKINATVEIGTADLAEVRVYSDGVLGSQQIASDGEIEFYVVANDTEFSFLLYLWETGNTGNYCFFDNVSLKAINDKHHATTGFLGDELVENESFASSGDWTAQTGWTVSGNDVATVDSSAAGTTNLTSTGMAVVVGRTYYAEMYVDSASGTGLRFDLGGVSGGSYLTTTGLRTATITALTTAGFSITASGSDTAAQVSRVSVKEVGVASGWTDADQQLHIPQTALQSYNELGMFLGVDDGTDSDITCGSDTSIDDLFDGGGTFSAWILPFSDGASNFGRIVDKGHWFFYLSSESGGNTYLNLYSANATTGTHSTSTSRDIKIGAWTHVVVSYNASTPSTPAVLYVNGVSVAVTETTEGAGARTSDAPQTLTIGNTQAGDRTFNGCITEASFWEEALTAAEVLELYNEGKALDATTHSQADELKAYWRNNGLSTWTDLSTNTNNGTVNNITETLLCPQGVDGSRDTQGFIMNKQRNTSLLNTDGVVYGQISDGDSFDFGTTAFTIQAWVKPRSLAANDRIITKGTDGNGDFMISVGGDNTSLRVYAKDSGAAAIDSTNDFSNLTLDTWQFITVVVDTPNDRILFYKDDGSVETKSGTFGGNFNNDNPITIATNSSLATTRFNGQIDGLLIYNKALNATEKTRNYKATKGSHRN
tara:strand:+ start:1518 stop:4862 length:3345 start_codon:yes stop_codon:yes gene_type:complete